MPKAAIRFREAAGFIGRPIPRSYIVMPASIQRREGADDATTVVANA